MCKLKIKIKTQACIMKLFVLVAECQWFLGMPQQSKKKKIVRKVKIFFPDVDSTISFEGIKTMSF